MEKTTYQGRIIEVVEKEVEERGQKKVFEFARRSPGVRLIIPKDTSILIAKEFRHEVGGYDYRLPGGKVFDTLKEYSDALASDTNISEAAMSAAIKEAREEAGIEVKEASLFHTSICGATIVWDLYYFVVNNFDQVEKAPEDGENISVEFIDRQKAKSMCLDGSMGEERSALVLLRYLLSREPPPGE